MRKSELWPAFIVFVLGVALFRAPAAELYNLDFTPPDVGTYETVFGSPSVQSSVGPFTDALLFNAVSSYEQIRLPIFVPGPQYGIHFDLFTHNLVDSKYLFAVLLDTPQSQNVIFHGPLDTIFVSNGADTTIGSLSNDQVYHMDISVDFGANRWTVALDGVQGFSAPINASGLQSIRFSMAPAIGGASDAPGTYAALDNVVVTVVPEPAAGLVLLAGGIFLRGRNVRRERRQARSSQGSTRLLRGK